LSYDLRKVKELLVGGVSLPDFDPLEAINSLYGAKLNKTTNYETVKTQQQAEFGASNVYFASSRFVEYFGTETLAEVLAEVLVGDPTDALRETAELLRLELNDMLAFLEMKGEAELANLGANILNAIMFQTDFSSPHVELRWTPVTYRYELELTGVVGQAYQALTNEDELAELIGAKPLAVDSPHAAFTLIWEPADVPDPLDPAWINLQLQLAIDEFDLRELSQPSLDFDLMNLVIGELGDLGVPDDLLDLAQLVLGSLGDVREIELELANWLIGRLGINVPNLELAFTGLGTICLENTVIGERLSNALKDKITFGNMDMVEVKKLCLDLTSYSLTASISLCHKHSWGTVGDVLETIGL
jgi:hypothetical protein